VPLGNARTEGDCFHGRSSDRPPSPRTLHARPYWRGGSRKSQSIPHGGVAQGGKAQQFFGALVPHGQPCASSGCERKKRLVRIQRCDSKNTRWVQTRVAEFADGRPGGQRTRAANMSDFQDYGAKAPPGSISIRLVPGEKADPREARGRRLPSLNCCGCRRTAPGLQRRVPIASTWKEETGSRCPVFVSGAKSRPCCYRA